MGGLYLILLSPFLGFDCGHHNPLDILSGKEFSYAIFNINDQGQMFKYIGYVNYHCFFILLIYGELIKY